MTSSSNQTFWQELSNHNQQDGYITLQEIQELQQQYPTNDDLHVIIEQLRQCQKCWHYYLPEQEYRSKPELHDKLNLTHPGKPTCQRCAQG